MKKSCFCVAVMLVISLILPFCAHAEETAADPFETLDFGEIYTYVVYEIENKEPDSSTGELEIDVSAYHLNVNDLVSFRDAVLRHNPQFFYWEGNIRYSYVMENSDKYVKNLIIKCTCTGEELAEKKEAFREMAEELYALKDEDWSDLETVVFYSDYLAANYQYDLTYSIYDAYNFLEKGTGVCQAYTNTFMLLMQHFGIPCTYASSQKINHIWNVVYVDGAWYHLDVTHNDPTYDRPGTARHTYTLTGETTTKELKSAADDLLFGAPVGISSEDHPVRAFLLSSVAPVTFVDGQFFAIMQNEKEAQLAAVSLDERSFTAVETLSTAWRVPGQAGYHYSGNFSSLATDGNYLYFSDDTVVYALDLITNEDIEVLSVKEETAIWGLQYQNGQLTVFTANSPNVKEFVGTAVENLPQPVYYTISWVIGEETFVTQVRAGADPFAAFNGSTEREDEKGVAYIFSGWSPSVCVATEDAVYTALYTERLLYLAGDINSDEKVNISDVTALLDILSGNSTADEPPYAADVNRDDIINISDVTALLDMLAGQTE